MAPLLSMTVPTFAAVDPGGWEHLRARVRAAEAAGIDKVVCSDHVVFGEHLDAYGDPANGGQRDGRQPTGPDGHWLEPLTALTWLAASTERVRLGTSILIAALRRPAVLAKQVATLDVLSGGRVDLGVGVGWQREEYEAAGLDFAGRGAQLDHTLAVCQTLWRDERASFADDRLRFDAIHQMPKPIQTGGVPIWVSGTVNAPVARRLARFGSGWIPWGDDAADLVTAIPRMAQAVADAGGQWDRIGVVGRLPLVITEAGVDRAAMADGVGPLRDAGVTDFRLQHRLPEHVDAAEAVLAEIVEAFAAATVT